MLDLIIVPPVIIVAFARRRLYAALSVVLMFIFFNLMIEQSQIGGTANAAPALAIAYLMGWFLPLILLLVAPAKAVTRRLIYLAIGLVLLIALNELSKLGLDVTAPKPS
jgi:hypothetical protein